MFGDSLAGTQSAFPRKLASDDFVFGSFVAVLRGDQLGVEFGIDSHSGLLREHGLLTESTQLVSLRLVRPSVLHKVS